MKTKEKKGNTYTMVLMVTSTAIGGTLQYGYNLAIMNGPTVANYQFSVLCSFLQFIQNFVNETYMERWGIQLGVYEVTLIWTFMVSIFSLGSFIGALIAGPMSVRFGRKKTMLLNNVFLFSSSLLALLSRTAKSFEMIIISRFLVGINAALQRLQGCEVQREELDEILQEQNETKGERAKQPWELFTDCSVCWQLITVAVLSSAMQLCAGVTGILPTEIFNQTTRPAVYMAAGSLIWLNLFIIEMIFSFLVSGLGQYCFLPFGAVCLLTASYIQKVLPETKGKTLSMITKEFYRLSYCGQVKMDPEGKQAQYQLGEIFHSTAL
ncbi:hypothetical protein cypCar_00038753 [Cyprinus carpio]|nr:hypothetical protein cypCar_00038753 [Cyprinus carpio]